MAVTTEERAALDQIKASGGGREAQKRVLTALRARTDSSPANLAEPPKPSTAAPLTPERQEKLQRDIEASKTTMEPPSLWNEIKTSNLAASHGIIDYASLGFADEIEAALQHPLSAAGIGDKGGAYRATRNDLRAQSDAAREASPGSYHGAGVSAGLAEAALTGGTSAAVPRATGGLLKAAAKGAAKAVPIGVAAGLGSSRAELSAGTPDKDVGQAAIDTAIGAVFAAPIGAGGALVGRGISRLAGRGPAVAAEEAAVKVEKPEAAASGAAAKVEAPAATVATEAVEAGGHGEQNAVVSKIVREAAHGPEGSTTSAASKRNTQASLERASSAGLDWKKGREVLYSGEYDGARAALEANGGKNPGRANAVAEATAHEIGKQLDPIYEGVGAHPKAIYDNMGKIQSRGDSNVTFALKKTRKAFHEEFGAKDDNGNPLFKDGEPVWRETANSYVPVPAKDIKTFAGTVAETAFTADRLVALPKKARALQQIWGVLADDVLERVAKAGKDVKRLKELNQAWAFFKTLAMNYGERAPKEATGAISFSSVMNKVGKATEVLGKLREGKFGAVGMDVAMAPIEGAVQAAKWAGGKVVSNLAKREAAGRPGYAAARALEGGVKPATTTTATSAALWAGGK